VTNHAGAVHERLEYTPYGELWIDWRSDTAPEDATPFRFTGQILDPETGLYYYGARYLDPKTSRWLGVDPAMAEYVPVAPVNDEARKQNENLPGLGGVFNYVNLHVYHYAGNNPVKYVDPTGREFEDEHINSITHRTDDAIDFDLLNTRVLMGTDGVPPSGPCYAMSSMGVALTYAGKNLEPDQVNNILATASLYDTKEQTVLNASGIIVAALTELGVDVSNLNISVERSPIFAEIAFATIRGVETFYRRGSDSGHFQEARSDGGFRWDPLDGTNDRGRNRGETRYILITPRNP
jgi:RHS repeat-associated protein